MLCFSSNIALLSNPNPNPFFASRRRVLVVPCAIDPNAITPSPTPELENHPLSRRQNQLLILDPDSQTKPRTNSHGGQETEEDLVKKKVIEEVSLATRRIPRFPGAIDRPDTQRLGPPPDLRRVLSGNDRTLKQALEVRRGVAAETLKFAFRAGKLSIRYSDNLVSKLPVFVDRVVIGAAAMKENPELAHLSFNARAKKYIQDSGVVALVKWLKHNSMTYPQIGKLLCMSSGDLEPVRELVEWLKSIYVKGMCLGGVVTKAGPIWERNLEELEEIVNFLEKKRVRKEWIGYVVSRCPQLLGMTMDELKIRVRFYLDMGMSENDFGTMVFDYPRALGYYSIEEMHSKVNYLKEFGLTTEDVGRLLAFKPQLMACSIEERWKPLVKYLYYLGIRRDGMRRMLLVKPVIFCVNMETMIAPKVRFLQDIGIKEEAIGGVLVKFPALLTYSLYKKIRPVVIFLMTKAGVTKEDIGKVIALDPPLVGCSITKKLDVNVKYFLSLGIRLRPLGEMIADFPMLLRYNLDILRPKYIYLRRTMVRPLRDLIEFPRFFSYSLEGRIIPRHKILVLNRINFKLRYMLASTDEDFNRRVREAVERRQRFESGTKDDDFCCDTPDDAETTGGIPVSP
ncbi:mTERF domain-containing protein mitochondrial protein [Dioscorea alata]|uniref:mTERF domain-containing protein mitochondrial protein n=2 Tax=Dioscorea alata TaxID=55571 RepID=A0ACB7UKJ9_DIOAL|nr:mTERF domain-containing protein mitochondrial protein [Dioscorea alata]